MVMDEAAKAVLKKLDHPGRSWGWYKIDRSISMDGTMVEDGLMVVLEKLKEEGYIDSSYENGITIFSITQAGRDIIQGIFD